MVTRNYQTYLYNYPKQTYGNKWGGSDYLDDELSSSSSSTSESSSSSSSEGFSESSSSSSSTSCSSSSSSSSSSSEGIWGNSFSITIPRERVGCNLTDFPVLLHLSASSAGIEDADVSAIFDELGNNSKRIKLEDQNSDQCYIEIESWDSVGEEAYLWAKVASIPTGDDITLTFYYDNNQADNTAYVGTVNSSVSENVWNSDYEAVWHISEGGVGTRYDSTTNDNDGTPQNYDGDEAVTGKIDGADDLNSTDYINCGAIDISTSTLTISGWVDVDSFQAASPYISTLAGIEEGVGAASQAALVRFGDAFLDKQKAQFVLCDSSGAQVKLDGNAQLQTGQWYHVAATYDGSDMVIYLNGEIDASNSGQISGAIQGTGTFKIGQSDVGRYLDGTIDDLRVMTSALSDCEVKAHYYSGDDNFIIWGSGDLSSSSSSS